MNLSEQAKTGFSYLPPLQFAFEYERFMLPVRLGMLNARGPQDLVAYVLTRNGRVETTNYRTVKLPANVELPTYVRGEFPTVYKALFETQAKREGYRVVWTEYFWDMGWCDPCSADTLSPEELRGAGVFWLDGDLPPSLGHRDAEVYTTANGAVGLDYCWAGVGSAGNDNLNCVPSWCEEVTPSRPPWASAIRRATNNPIPRPFEFEDLANRSKRRGRIAGSIPGPWSVIATSAVGCGTDS